MHTEAMHTKSTQANRNAKFVVLVPAYEPDETLLLLVEKLLTDIASEAEFGGIVVVDDGSKGVSARTVFTKLREREKVVVLAHPQNLGKGGALKTGFRYVLKNMNDITFVVTADADGQHTPSDIFKIARNALETGNPTIGARVFGDGVPLRSRFGNIATALIFRVAAGVNILDTQSGLRAYRREDLPKLITIVADRYEFEFHCLFELARNGQCPLDQIAIETIYEPGNPTSHFNPLMDSVRIYIVFFRYVSVSAISGMLDFLFFSILTLFSAPTLFALVLARIGSAPFYFYGMRNIAFKSRGNVYLQAGGTILLMLAHITFLWRFITWLEAQFGVHPIGAMFAGLLLFYIGNFFVQRFIIYPIKRSR